MAPNKLSAPAKVGLLLKFLFCLLPTGLFNIAKAAVRAWYHKLPFGPALTNAFARPLMANVPPYQIQAIFPGTRDTYLAWSKVDPHTSEPIIETVADGETRILWLRQKKGKNVLLFFHGGGYVMPLSPGHLDWMAHILDETTKAGIELDICVLEYDLIPDSPYPRQMNQAIVSLKHLLASGYAPGNIIFGGDSAGGHLALSLLSHLHHPRPGGADLSTLIKPTEKIKGCFLVSPLASFDVEAGSYQKTLSVDVLGKEVVAKWGDLLVRGSSWYEERSKGYGWGMALDVPEEWWNDLDSVSNILITAGDEEVFWDHNVQLLDVLRRKGKAQVTGCMAAKEAHDVPLMDFMAKRPPGKTTKFITEWIIAQIA
ncbi:catalytic protein [Penicillium paradoxum]|uniref:catalytic protein n=1 Tax=Penicillium paradoxum TaxID=176176 RepID=UPI002549927F|nr:catalytic protein [Penicillium paradoxum]KAJ5780062.1 catalytic protein [Penicillium paradoxum]